MEIRESKYCSRNKNILYLKERNQECEGRHTEWRDLKTMVYHRASPAVPTQRLSQLRNAYETLAIWVHEVCIQIKYLLIINHKLILKQFCDLHIIDHF